MNINILLATYNGEEFLEQQLESILSQTHTNWKLYIHDDNSTDNTDKTIKTYVKKFPNKIIFLDDKVSFGNPSKNFMYLLEKIDGEYFMFCDQDDIWLPNKIELTFNKMKQLEKTHSSHIPLLTFTDLKVINANLEVINNSFWRYQKLNPCISQNWKKLLAQNVITGCTIMINKKAKEICLPYELDIMVYDHWIGVNISKYGQVGYQNDQTILYRQHEHNTEGAKKFGLYYIFYKLKHIKKIISFQYTVSKYFKIISTIELVYYKFTLNLIRFL